MRRICLAGTAVIFCVLILLTSGCSNLSVPDPAAVKDKGEAELRKELAKLTKKKLPGMAVLVARDGKIVFQDGFGMADIKNKEPVTLETKFRIGSVSKQFTAAAILRLAEEGKLALTDPLDKFFPGFPNGREITIHHLLTHTSGMHSYTSKKKFRLLVSNPMEPDLIIAWFRDDPPDFAPGEGSKYCNSGYFLLGEIAAKVSGMSCADCLQELLFDPLEMKNTGTYVNSNPPPQMAIGYSLLNGRIEPALDWDMSWAGGAGQLYSTVGDLFIWNEALFGGRVLKEKSLKKMTTPVELPEKVDGLSYGYGVALYEIQRLPAVGHTGGLDGWASRLIRLPEQNCTIAVLGNCLPMEPGKDVFTWAQQMPAIFLDDVISNLPPHEVYAEADKTRWPDYVGRYDYKRNVLTVTFEDGRLYARLTGQPKREIFPKAPDKFFWKTADAEVTFLRNEEGKVTAARHNQNANIIYAPLLTAPDVVMTEAELDAILGKYRLRRRVVITVTRDGDRVFAQLTSQPRFPIFPVSKTEFEWHEVEAKITFVKEKGKITKGIFVQNGIIIEARKIR